MDHPSALTMIGGLGGRALMDGSLMTRLVEIIEWSQKPIGSATTTSTTTASSVSGACINNILQRSQESKTPQSKYYNNP